MKIIINFWSQKRPATRKTEPKEIVQKKSYKEVCLMTPPYFFRHRSIFLALVACLLMSAVLAGCGSGNGTAPSSGGETAAPNASPSTSPSASDAAGGQSTEAWRTIEHAMGKTDIPAHPQRVVVLTNEGTEALLALGVKPVGAVNSWTGDPWYDHIADEMEGVTPVGTESQVNLEAIAALKPDLIIGNKMRQEKVYEQLSAIAPTVFSETLRGNWKINFELYAKALNKEAEGREVLQAFDRRVDGLKEKYADRLSMKISVVRFMPGVIRLYQKNSFSGVILDQIGFARPASQDVDGFAEEITRERIPDMDGDVLFYFTYDTGDGQGMEMEKQIIGDPLFRNLDVVKKGRAFRVDDTIWNTAGGVIAANLMLDDLDQKLSRLP